MTFEPGVIKVHFEQSGHLCGDPPIPQPYSVFLPPLAVREEPHRVEVTADPEDGVLLSTTFLVHRGGTPPFRVQPSVARIEWAGTKQFAIESAQPLCTTAVNCRVEIEGRQATDVTVHPESNTIVFTAPELELGSNDVGVDNGVSFSLVRNALFVTEGTEAAAPSLFEPVLFPLLLDAPGANGSLWRTEAAVSNPKPWPVYAWDGQVLLPGAFIRVEGGQYGRGFVLRVPRGQAPNVAFSLRARDVSRVDEGYGTEIPVVREKDFFLDTPFTLLDVPVERGYRVKLRLYALTTSFPSAAVTVATAGGTTSTTFASWAPVCEDSGCHSYAELDLPSDGGDGARADVTVTQLHVPVWGFITVTNNETQQVTVVTPGGKGGRP